MPSKRQFPPFSCLFLLLATAYAATLAQEPAAGTETAPENKPAAAVYVTGDVPGYQRDFVGAYLQNALTDNGTEVNDENAAAFLKVAGLEQSKRQKAPIDDSLICELARKSGIRYILTASITPTPSGPFTLSGRVISARTGKSRFHGEAAGTTITMGSLAQAAETLLEKMFNGKPVFSPSPPTDTSSSNKVAERRSLSISAPLNDHVAEGSRSHIPQAQHQLVSTPLNELSRDSAEIIIVNNDESAASDTVAAPDNATTVHPETEEKPKIAVYVTGDVPENDKSALGTRMLATFVNSGRYRGVERSAQFLAELEKEHIKQRSGDVDDSQISELGKQFGVNIICVAAITPTLGSYQVSARIIDVETAEVTHIGESNSPLKTLEDLTIVSSEVVSNMFGRQLSIAPEQRRPKGKYSAGAGALYAGGLGGGIAWSDGLVSMPYSGGGVYLFFSHTYASAHITYLSGGRRWESDNAYGDKYELPDMQRIDLNIGIYAKYPIGIFENITVFPTAGFDYNVCADAKLVRADGSKYTFDGTNEHAHVTGDLNELWTRLGIGVDVDIGWNVYMRGEALYGARFANAFEWSYVYEDGYPKLAHGPMLRVGAGIRF